MQMKYKRKMPFVFVLSYFIIVSVSVFFFVCLPGQILFYHFFFFNSLFYYYYKDILTSKTAVLSFTIRMPRKQNTHSATRPHTHSLQLNSLLLLSLFISISRVDSISFPIHIRIYLQNLEPSLFAMPIEQLFKQKCIIHVFISITRPLC